MQCPTRAMFVQSHCLVCSVNWTRWGSMAAGYIKAFDLNASDPFKESGSNLLFGP